MFEIKGKHNTAKIFTDNIDSSAIDQIRELCDQEFVRGSRIRIMPDAHAGAGCTIGTTMTVRDKIVPNLVGVDIGCGMAVLLHESEIDLEKLDRVIYNKILQDLTSGVQNIPIPRKLNWKNWPAESMSTWAGQC